MALEWMVGLQACNAHDTHRRHCVHAPYQILTSMVYMCTRVYILFSRKTARSFRMLKILSKSGSGNRFDSGTTKSVGCTNDVFFQLKSLISTYHYFCYYNLYCFLVKEASLSGGKKLRFSCQGA